MRLLVTSVTSLCMTAPAALGAAIPGATYNGTAADGARVTFTVSPDGTIVDSYRISGVMANNCMFLGEGDQGVWPGAPIVAGMFEYHLYDAILFRGSFPGPQNASGTFRFDNHATPPAPACDTGEVSWTATTTATPPSTGTPGGQPGGGKLGGGTPPKKPTFVTRMQIRKRGSKLVVGQIRSSDAACRADRKVILWRGRRQFAATRSKADGTFAFKRSAKLRGHSVRASAPRQAIRAGICAAGSSTFVRM